MGNYSVAGPGNKKNCWSNIAVMNSNTNNWLKSRKKIKNHLLWASITLIVNFAKIFRDFFLVCKWKGSSGRFMGYTDSTGFPGTLLFVTVQSIFSSFSCFAVSVSFLSIILCSAVGSKLIICTSAICEGKSNLIWRLI